MAPNLIDYSAIDEAFLARIYEYHNTPSSSSSDVPMASAFEFDPAVFDDAVVIPQHRGNISRSGRV